MQRKTIGQIAGIIPLKGASDTSSLGRWFRELLDKSTEDLTICDITRMIQQNTLIQIAIPIALEKIIESPFAGEMYDGQLAKIMIDASGKHKGILSGFDINSFQRAIAAQKDEYCFISDKSKEECIELCEKLKNIAICYSTKNNPIV